MDAKFLTCVDCEVAFRQTTIREMGNLASRGAGGHTRIYTGFGKNHWNRHFRSRCYEQAPISNWLCAIARAQRDVSPYLACWTANSFLAALSNLERFVAEHAVELSTRRTPEGYWQDAPEQWSQVADWVSSLGLLEREPLWIRPRFGTEASPQRKFIDLPCWTTFVGGQQFRTDRRQPIHYLSIIAV